MLKKILYIGVMQLGWLGYGQDTIVSFSNALQANMRSYIKASNKAYLEQNFQEGQRLFDSLVNYKLIGTQFDDFTVKNLNSKKITLSKLGKPVFILTYASWGVINKGDIPAINRLAEEHDDDLQIMIFFWGTKDDLEKTSRLFHKKIQICYTDTRYRENFDLVKRLKNTLGFPTSYFIDSQQKVVTINRISNPMMSGVTLEDATANSYLKFNSMINTGVLKNSTSKIPVARN
ncbi:TlpA family protein disulfide reductase [Flavobacterium agrisoli]|uniref:Redoxin domain-containing protein n=1 Tax=Flavobacterium agrisoli TaxID=2793066 RepID=A0A934PM90_9FLAO|nr:redoxin domain-containing protein [Flavobacterium agrisoli]MBK0370781.1 redoxin domain-containing protein [Flavobacterium agrisoli]